jgi:hypothetical protein
LEALGSAGLVAAVAGTARAVSAAQAALASNRVITFKNLLNLLLTPQRRNAFRVQNMY